MRFDHAILAVEELDSARADFHALGFRTAYGGEHSGGLTHNALIGFADGSYLELMAPTDPAHLIERPQDGYLYIFQAGEGFAGYALHSEDLEAALRGMRQRGVTVDQPQRGGRLRSDGVRLAWRMATAPPGMSPFFLTDETPRELRVPGAPEAVAHPNQVTGVAGLLIAVDDLQAAIERYRAILGAEPDPAPCASCAEFALGDFHITLVEPAERTGPPGVAPKGRGEGPYRLRLRIGSGGTVGLLDPARTHGGEIELVADG